MCEFYTRHMWSLIDWFLRRMMKEFGRIWSQISWWATQLWTWHECTLLKTIFWILVHRTVMLHKNSWKCTIALFFCLSSCTLMFLTCLLPLLSLAPKIIHRWFLDGAFEDQVETGPPAPSPQSQNVTRCDYRSVYRTVCQNKEFPSNSMHVLAHVKKWR